MQETQVPFLSQEDPWRRKWQLTPVLLPRKFHGWRSLVGYSPWGHKESDRTEWLHFHFLFHFYWASNTFSKSDYLILHCFVSKFKVGSGDNHLQFLKMETWNNYNSSMVLAFIIYSLWHQSLNICFFAEVKIKAILNLTVTFILKLFFSCSQI